MTSACRLERLLFLEWLSKLYTQQLAHSYAQLLGSSQLLLQRPGLWYDERHLGSL